MITLRWAIAKKLAFPYSEAKVAGPFDTMAAAHAAADRLAPMYPNCRVFPRLENVSNKRGAMILGGDPIAERTTPLVD